MYSASLLCFAARQILHTNVPILRRGPKEHCSMVK